MLEPSHTKFDEMNEWIETKLKKKILFQYQCAVYWESDDLSNVIITLYRNIPIHIHIQHMLLSMCTWNYYTSILLTFQTDIWMMAIQFGDFWWTIYKLFFIVFFQNRYEYIWNKIMPSDKPVEQLLQKIKLNQYIVYSIEIWNQTFKFHSV